MSTQACCQAAVRRVDHKSAKSHTQWITNQNHLSAPKICCWRRVYVQRTPEKKAFINACLLFEKISARSDGERIYRKLSVSPERCEDRKRIYCPLARRAAVVLRLIYVIFSPALCCKSNLNKLRSSTLFFLPWRDPAAHLTPLTNYTRARSTPLSTSQIILRSF